MAKVASGRGPELRGRLRRACATGVVSGFFLLLSGCASAPPAPTLPPLDAGELADAAEAASSLDAPYRLVFEWALNEPEARLRGRGVARVEPPFRGRLDLFLPNGEQVAAASLVGDDLRVRADARAQLPVAALLWGTLGVFHPGPSSALGGGSWQGNGEAELRYLPAGGGELRYRLQGDRLERIELLRNGSPHEEVRLERAAGDRFPREAVYRHLTQVRELIITLETVEHVESYPSDIWDPTL